MEIKRFVGEQIDCVFNKAMSVGEFVLDRVLGEAEVFEYRGSTTPAQITIIESEPEDIVA